jgi:hypothetical protein
MKLTSDDLQALYDALPLKARQKAISDEYSKIATILGEFAMAHFGYSSMDEVKKDAYEAYMDENGRDATEGAWVADHIEFLLDFLISQADEE